MKIFKRKLTPKQYAAIQHLADGIECGAAIRPQAIGKFFEPTENGQVTSCALGAAWECAMIEKRGAEAITPAFLQEGIDEPDFTMESVLKLYGFKSRARMIEQSYEGQKLCTDFTGLSVLILRLNDDFKWSRERIAQFLREIE